MQYAGISRRTLYNKIKGHEIGIDTALIIFLDTDQQKENPIINLTRKYDRLILSVDDIEHACSEEPNLIPPTKKTAYEIENFIKSIKENKLIISCTAGISRTGAVIHYLDVLNHKSNIWIKVYDPKENIEFYKKDNYIPNIKLDRELQKTIK